MGKALSVLNKHYFRFNAENRAHRMIAKEKPFAAPRHPSTVNHLKSSMAETEEIMSIMAKKDSELDEKLKKVYIKSHDPIPSAKVPNFGKPSEKARQLPSNRSTPGNQELGYIEPAVVPEGKITLKQVMALLTKFQEDPQKNNVNVLSQIYNLPVEDTNTILSYFSNFKLHIPEPKIEEKKGNVMKILKSSNNSDVKVIEAKKEVQ